MSLFASSGSLMLLSFSNVKLSVEMIQRLLTLEQQLEQQLEQHRVRRMPSLCNNDCSGPQSC